MDVMRGHFCMAFFFNGIELFEMSIKMLGCLLVARVLRFLIGIVYG